jgi:hypothetical protein
MLPTDVMARILPTDVMARILQTGSEPLVQRQVCREWREATDRDCAGWAGALQRYAREFLTLYPRIEHDPQACTPCRPDTGFFISTVAPKCLNMHHYRVPGRAAIRFLLQRAMPTEYDVDVLRSQITGMATAQHELEATRRTLMASITSRIHDVVESRERTAGLLREAFAKRRAIFHLLNG